ncbi:hypothetical protein N657DRAFT_118592 [Parathielavia appendiculata]|uniref:Uncharacterized protein n=1 Tax=Parathielavia appendiculata TaxID=2587402 RepID=A0AAN6TWD9_9PEZI|nr:hypothetical protein N657DRAFT_118592 [Parathielavia appendiculata]
MAFALFSQHTSLFRISGAPGLHAKGLIAGEIQAIGSITSLIPVFDKACRLRRGGNTLRTHGDVLPWVRELFYAKDQQSSERGKRKRQASLSESLPPIHIKALSARCNQDSAGYSAVPAPDTRGEPGIRYATLHRYCEWLCARATDPGWKSGYRDACGRGSRSRAALLRPGSRSQVRC